MIGLLHTVHETKDLTAAKQAEIDHLKDMWRQYSAAWQSKDPSGAATFQAGYNKALADWAVASASANRQIVASFIHGSEDVITAEDDYQAVLAVGAEVQQLAWAWPSALLGVGYAGAGYTVPQPTAPDFNMAALNRAADVAMPIASAVDQIPLLNRLPGGNVPPNDPLNFAFQNPKTTLAIAGAGLLGIFILTRR